MSSSIPNDLKRILAIRLDNIGDVVMTGPALRALRQAYPEAQITLMASPAGSQAAPLLPWIDEVITWRAVWQEIGENIPIEPEKEQALLEMIEARRFDAAFIFTSFSQSPYPPAYACYLARVPVRAGQSKEFGGGLLSHWVRSQEDTAYQVDRNLHLLRATGILVENSHLELRVRLADEERADAILARTGISANRDYLVLAPGASAAARRYDERRFAEAARRLCTETGLPLVLVGGAREAGKFPALEQLAEELPQVISLIGQTSVAEMASIVQRSTLVICNNSGAMHIAAAFEKPLVVLFAGTERMEQWLPRSEKLRVLNRATGCTPCYGFQCPYQMECLEIPAEEVAGAVIELLNQEALCRPVNPNLIKAISRSLQP